MSSLNLGVINFIPVENNINDSLIVSDIVDSDMSPEKPILVRSIEELDIYFGKNFSQRNYYKELLKRGNITLYLYKPIRLRETRQRVYKTRYFERDKIVYYFEEDNCYKYYSLGWNNVSNILEDENKELYRNLEVTYEDVLGFGETINSEHFSNLRFYNSIGDLIFDSSEWKHQENFIDSYNNRDSLRLLSIEEGGHVVEDKKDSTFYLDYTYPSKEVSQLTYKDLLESWELSDSYESFKKIQKIESGFSGLVASIYIPENTFNININNGKYFVFTYKDGEGDSYKDDFVVKFGNIPNEVGSDIIYRSNSVSLYRDGGYETKDGIVSSFSRSILEELKYALRFTEKRDEDGNPLMEEREIKFLSEYLVKDGKLLDKNDERNKDSSVGIYLEYYYPSIFPVRNFSNISGLSMKIDTKKTWEILTNLSEDFKRIDFYSRTIGYYDEKIKLKIHKILDKPGFYTVELSRFGYLEIFEGSLEIDSGKDRLDTVINRNSKLVSCEIFFHRPDTSLYKVEDSDFDIPEGEYELKGSISEKASYSSEMYKTSLEIMKNSDVLEDIFLVPDISKYCDNLYPDTISYYQEYLDFLIYSKEKNCQFFITNYLSEKIVFEFSKNNKKSVIDTFKEFSKELVFYNTDDSEYYTIVDSDLVKTSFLQSNIYYNLIESENRLVYFYGDIILPQSQESRPGYYLYLNGIQSGKFEMSSTKINYIGFSESENFSLQERYKSNFLLCNNYKYYYKRLQLNPSDVTTITTRFLLLRISHEFERKKWNLLGKRTMFEVRTEVNNILSDLYEKYSFFLRSLDISSLTIEQQVVDLQILFTTTEFIDKDITINITLKQNN